MARRPNNNNKRSNKEDDKDKKGEGAPIQSARTEASEATMKVSVASVAANIPEKSGQSGKLSRNRYVP